MCKLRIHNGTALAVSVGAFVIALGPAAADQVIPDDLIVQSSLCVGIDCVNGEAFEFATIRLKENNTRIDFMDTSADTFPTRDWRLEANSSAGGGANYFAIKDMGNAATGVEGGTALLTVTAGAPANSLFVASTGRVGLRTSTPVLDMHIRTGNTPGLRLEQDASSGFSAQTWDIAGNEANFFVRDVTGGSRLSLRIRPGAPTSSVDVAASGNVGFGTASPQTTLHARSSGSTALRLDTTGSSGAQWQIFTNANTGRLQIQDVVSSNNPIRILPGAPTAAIDISVNNLTFSQYPNCAGLGTNASGVLQCQSSAPSPPPGAASASMPAAGTTLASVRASAGGSVRGYAGGPAPDSAANGDEYVGCSAGDLSGNWSLIGTSIQKFGDNSVLWCDLRFTAGQNGLTYSVSGRCRSHEPNDPTQRTSDLTAKGTITENAACRFGGSLTIKQGNALLTTATIIEGRIEGPGARKTRAVGVSRLTRGRTSALQTVVMQR